MLCANGVDHSEEETYAPGQPTTGEGQLNMQEAYASEHWLTSSSYLWTPGPSSLISRVLGLRHALPHPVSLKELPLDFHRV